MTNTTKQKTRYTIDLPPEAVEVLRWHIRTQLELPTQQDRDLLFPSINGTFRTPTVLDKPFAEVSETIGLGYHFTHFVQHGERVRCEDRRSVPAPLRRYATYTTVSADAGSFIRSFANYRQRRLTPCQG